MKLAIKVNLAGDGQYRGECPVLPGCVAYGMTEQEVVSKLDVAVRGYLASLDAVVPTEIEPEIIGV